MNLQCSCPCSWYYRNYFCFVWCEVKCFFTFFYLLTPPLSPLKPCTIFHGFYLFIRFSLLFSLTLGSILHASTCSSYFFVVFSTDIILLSAAYFRLFRLFFSKTTLHTLQFSLFFLPFSSIDFRRILPYNFFGFFFRHNEKIYIYIWTCRWRSPFRVNGIRVMHVCWCCWCCCHSPSYTYYMLDVTTTRKLCAQRIRSMCMARSVCTFSCIMCSTCDCMHFPRVNFYAFHSSQDGCRWEKNPKWRKNLMKLHAEFTYMRATLSGLYCCWYCRFIVVFLRRLSIVFPQRQHFLRLSFFLPLLPPSYWLSTICLFRLLFPSLPSPDVSPLYPPLPLTLASCATFI